MMLSSCAVIWKQASRCHESVVVVVISRALLKPARGWYHLAVVHESTVVVW